MDSVLTLYTSTKQQNEYGVWVETLTSRDVFCKVGSISRYEFFEAGRNGLNPQFVFSVFKGDYNGEIVCGYEGNTYSIYRTYQTDSDYLELYAERKGGTNGAQTSQTD